LRHVVSHGTPNVWLLALINDEGGKVDRGDVMGRVMRRVSISASVPSERKIKVSGCAICPTSTINPTKTSIRASDWCQVVGRAYTLAP
jgi:hypothetical protein